MYSATYEPIDTELLPPDESRDLIIESNNSSSVKVHKGLLRLRTLEDEPTWLKGEETLVDNYDDDHFRAFYEAAYLNIMDFKYPAKTSKLWKSLSMLDEAIKNSDLSPSWTCGPLVFNQEEEIATKRKLLK